MDKVRLRKEMLKKRDSFDSEDRIKADNEILAKLLATSLFKRSENVFIYVSFGSEVDTKNIINIALMKNKKVFIPKILKETNKMEAVRISSLWELEKNKYGILEAKESKEIAKRDELDVIIMPGVVFDQCGNRIGYGGGYYDRYLSEISNKKNKIALAYDFQIIGKLDCEDHDIKVNCLISQNSIKFF